MLGHACHHHHVGVGVDVLVQILRMLPVRSLLRARCVCRLMKDIIDSEVFRQEHLSVQNQKPRLLVQSGLDLGQRQFFLLDLGKLCFFTDRLKEPIRMNRLFLVGTLHGIVCFYEMEFGLRFWNPSTRRLSTRNLRPLPVRSLNLRLSENNYCYSGFWINPSNRHFKVILFRLWASVMKKKAVLYDSNKSRWIRLPMGAVETRSCRCRLDGDGSQMSSAVIIGDQGYWMGIHDQQYWVIISFDFVAEMFDMIKMPVSILGVDDRVNISPQGKLLSVCYFMKEEGKCVVYLRTREDDSWICLYQFNLIFQFPAVREIFWASADIKGGGGNRALASTQAGLVFYDSRHGIIHLRKVDWISYHVIMAYDFVESLLFPFP